MKCPVSQEDEDPSAPHGQRPMMRNGGQELNDDVDFSEYLWMGEENLEEFDRKVELELWEEQFIEACFEEMWNEEDKQAVVYTTSTGSEPGTHNVTDDKSDLPEMMQNLRVENHNQINQVLSSKLNPNAAIFIPKGLTTTVPPGQMNGNVER